QIVRRADACDIPIAGDLRHRRAHDLGAGDLLPDGRENIARLWRIEKSPSHAVQALLEFRKKRSRRVFVEQWNVRKRAVDLRPVWPDRREYVVAAGHSLSPRFAWCQLWNVCFAGCGTSRCFPQALRPL